MLRGHSLANRCCMCWCSREFVDNLLLQCHVANSLWVFMLQALGIQWVLLGSVAELLFCWSYWLGKRNSNIWNLILGCLMWTIWTERNRHSFEDSKFVFFNVQCVHCSQLTLTQVLLQKKNLNTRKAFKVYTNNSMQVPIHEKM